MVLESAVVLGNLYRLKTQNNSLSKQVHPAQHQEHLMDKLSSKLSDKPSHGCEHTCEDRSFGMKELPKPHIVSDHNKQQSSDHECTSKKDGLPGNKPQHSSGNKFYF